MYKNFFGLQESPFTIAPDPRYLYMSEKHREALAHLLYGLKYEGGFVLLTGEVGTGKTTVCRCLLEQVPTETDVALILNPHLTVPELLDSICREFSIEVPKTESVKVLVDALNRFLLDCNQKGRKAVLVLDEAQNLSCEVLDQIRLLTNLETTTRKLLQIIMLGQPELLEKLALPEMRQVAQRITARYHLEPLSEPEVKEYVRHRWTVAGGKGDFLNDRQLRRLYALSKGIPRIINVICDRILLGAYSQDTRQVSMAMLSQAAREVLGEVDPRRRIARGKASGAFWVALAIIGIFLFSSLAWRYIADRPAPATRSLPPAGGASLSSGGNSRVAPAKTVRHVLSVRPAGEKAVAAAKAASPDSGKPMEWRLKDGATSTRRRAFDDLFAQWGLSLPSSAPFACHFAEESGLKCLFRRGSLADLFAANRPAVLEMSSDDGVPFSAVLVRLDHRRATLTVLGQVRQASADQVARHWSGRYIMVWKPPPGYTGPIKQGMEGPVMRWLAKGLAEVGGLAARAPSFSAVDLKRAITKFQIKVGLVPDGIAGRQTIMQLNSRIDKKVPRLHAVLP